MRLFLSGAAVGAIAALLALSPFLVIRALRLRRLQDSLAMIRLISHNGGKPSGFDAPLLRCDSFVLMLFDLGAGPVRRDRRHYTDTQGLPEPQLLGRVSRLLSKRAPRGVKSCCCIWGGQLVAALGFTGQTSGASKLAGELCDEILDICGGSAVLGRLMERGDMAPFYFDELREAQIKNAFLDRRDRVIHCGFRDEDAQKAPLSTEKKSLERGLFLCLANSDFEGAESALDELIAAVGDDDYSDVDNFKMRLFILIETSAYVLGFRTGREDILSDITPDFMGDFDRSETAAALRKTALSFIGCLRDRLNIQSAAKTDYAQKAERMANERFREPELNMTSISEELGVNISQLSRSFKKSKNITLSDYLQLLRVTEAKRLLAETRMSVEQVAERSGFVSAKNLYRAFSKQEGVTPAKFRKSGDGSVE